MKHLFLLLSISCFLITNTYSQSNKEKKKEHERMLDTLEQKISGVKYVDFNFSTAQ